MTETCSSTSSLTWVRARANASTSATGRAGRSATAAANSCGEGKVRPVPSAHSVWLSSHRRTMRSASTRLMLLTQTMFARPRTAAASLSPTRQSLMDKGIVYAPQRGSVAYTVPGMAAYLRRHDDEER